MKINVPTGDDFLKWLTVFGFGGVLQYLLNFRNIRRQTAAKSRADEANASKVETEAKREALEATWIEVEKTNETALKSAEARARTLAVEEQALELYGKIRQMYEESLARSFSAEEHARDAAMQTREAVKNHEECEKQLKLNGLRIDELERINAAKVQVSLTPNEPCKE